MSEAQSRQLEYVTLANLTPLEPRDVREHYVEQIRERVDEKGYNPAKPLRVKPDGDDDEYLVIDGNHRVKAARASESVSADETLPCVVEPADADVLEIAHKSNEDEDTFAQQDLFDYLGYIENLRDEHTQAQIAERLGWIRGKVNHHTRLLEQVDTEVVGLAREHQQGRVSSDDTVVSSFSEGWFRNSGLYELSDAEPYALPDEEEPTHPQVRVMEWFCEEKNCNPSTNAVSNKVEDIQDICGQLEQLDEELNSGVEDETREELRDEIVQGGYTEDTLQSAIDNANENAKDRLLFGTDALAGLDDVDDNSVDCVVTDPPYGVDYESHRETDRPEFPDDEEAAFELLTDVFAELERVCKANAHLYVFFATKHIEQMKEAAAAHFEVTETPLVWVKNNHAPTQDAERGFEKRYAQKYETVLVCRMPNGRQRKLRDSVSDNVFEYAKPDGDERAHDTQKPRGLLTDLITNSTGPRETVLDPFAGSGSTALAAAESGRHYIGFELSDEYEHYFRKELREVTDE